MLVTITGNFQHNHRDDRYVQFDTLIFYIYLLPTTPNQHKFMSLLKNNVQGNAL